MIDSALAEQLQKAGFSRVGIHLGTPTLLELISACEAANKAGEFVLKKRSMMMVVVAGFPTSKRISAMTRSLDKAIRLMKP